MELPEMAFRLFLPALVPFKSSLGLTLNEFLWDGQHCYLFARCASVWKPTEDLWHATPQLCGCDAIGHSHTTFPPNGVRSQWTDHKSINEHSNLVKSITKRITETSVIPIYK